MSKPQTELPKVWPEGCKLLIEVDEADAVTPGGIVVPNQARENMQMSLTMGTILRVGPHATTAFADGKELKPGSRVVFAKYGGYRLREVETRRDLRIINDEDVLVLLEDTWV